MRLNFVICILIGLMSCRKESSEDNKSVTPPILIGQWKRGVFEMTQFHNWQGTDMQNSSLTTGAMELYSDGTIKMYSASFPTNPSGGCNPQVFQLFEGTGKFTADGKIVASFSAGTERLFYQQCAGKTNSSRKLTQADFNGDLTMYWSVNSTGSKNILSIRYDRPDNPALLFEQTSW